MADAQSDRLVFTFFHQPNYDAVIETLPTCRDGAPAAPITYAEHWTAKWMATKA